jgi:purine-binding chemotaxis protein CheW
MSEYLTFSLAGDRYAFSIKDIDSVVEASDFTRLPQEASYMRGIMNLRGAMIPVVDLRLKFGLQAQAERAKESVIVLCFEEKGGTRLVGAIADEVHEVLVLDDGQIEEAPSLSSRRGGEKAFVSGIGKTDSGFIVVLDAAVARGEIEEGEESNPHTLPAYA